jgi:hypothetical protein
MALSAGAPIRPMSEPVPSTDPLPSGSRLRTASIRQGRALVLTLELGLGLGLEPEPILEPSCRLVLTPPPPLLISAFGPTRALEAASWRSLRPPLFATPRRDSGETADAAASPAGV